MKDYKEPLITETVSCYLLIFEKQLTFKELTLTCEDTCNKLRNLACIALTDENTTLFYHHLMRSARVRIFFLERCAAENQANHYLCASNHNEPFFDAMAAGDFERAERIAALSPKEWLSNAEYEEDYIYSQILYRLIGQSTSNQEINGLLKHFETALEGSPDARLPLCHALFEKNQDNFDKAFAAFLKKYEEEKDDNNLENEFEDEIEYDDEDEPIENSTSSLIFIEGLAILKLAEKLGLTTQKEYPFCPAVARLPMTKPFPEE